MHFLNGLVGVISLAALALGGCGADVATTCSKDGDCPAGDRCARDAQHPEIPPDPGTSGVCVQPQHCGGNIAHPPQCPSGWRCLVLNPDSGGICTQSP